MHLACFSPDIFILDDYALFWTIMLPGQCLEQFVLHKTHNTIYRESIAIPRIAFLLSNVNLKIRQMIRWHTGATAILKYERDSETKTVF